ncbi:MAG: SUMF1/EgtB/PvdO family nonheme iron enzyme, partial [Terriglobales bacterium]
MRQPNSLHQTEDGPKLIAIPAGWFLMGSEDGQDNERPVHRVWVDDFWLAECQVTNAEYAKFVRATGAEAPPLFNDPNFNHPQQPVVAICWFEAVRYCEWLSGLHGGSYRLPTEVEWERAARGGVAGKLFPWGDAPPESLPDYAKRWRNGPEMAGCADPNGFGLRDLCANVHEWCSDWFQGDYYGSSPERNPRGPETG